MTHDEDFFCQRQLNFSGNKIFCCVFFDFTVSDLKILKPATQHVENRIAFYKVQVPEK